MNSLEYFRTLEDDGELRADRQEGLAAVHQPSSIGELRFGEFNIPPEDLAGPLTVRYDADDDARILCMYSVNHRGFLGDADEELVEFIRLARSTFRFGDHLVVVTRTQEFFDRMKKGAARSGGIRSMYAQLVEYFDDATFDGHIERPGFYKLKAYAEQREFRIRVDFWQKPVEGPFVLDVGDLSDITVLTTPDEFNRTIRVSRKHAKASSEKGATLVTKIGNLLQGANLSALKKLVSTHVVLADADAPPKTYRIEIYERGAQEFEHIIYQEIDKVWVDIDHPLDAHHEPDAQHALEYSINRLKVLRMTPTKTMMTLNAPASSIGDANQVLAPHVHQLTQEVGGSSGIKAGSGSGPGSLGS